MHETIIIGGGLAGLSTAAYLDSDWILLERESQLGGLVVTHSQRGFHFDVTGHWLHLRDEGIRKWVKKLLPGEMISVERKAQIFSQGVYTQYPFQANTHGLPPEVVKEILTGYIDHVLLNPTKKEPKTFEDWVLKHMGPGIAKYFMIPYNEKLWRTHPSEMTPLWCQRYVPKPSLDEILEGALVPKESKAGYNATFMYPKEGGIGRLSQSIAETLDPLRVFTRTRPVAINAKKRLVQLQDGSTVGYQNLVNTMPLPELVKIIGDVPNTVREAAKKLVYNQVLYFNLALRKKVNTDAIWLYFPEPKFHFYRVGCFSNAVPSMAPEGASSLYVEISHRGNRIKPGANYKQVISGLMDARLIEHPNDIEFYEKRNIDCAYVVFDKNYEKATKTIHTWLQKQGIQSIGRYGKWTYNSMETAMLDGRETAFAIDGKPLNSTRMPNTRLPSKLKLDNGDKPDIFRRSFLVNDRPSAEISAGEKLNQLRRNPKNGTGKTKTAGKAKRG